MVDWKRTTEMASELDEFFAKKEKKKKKTKGKKFVTTEEIVKTIDTTENEATDNTASVLEKTASSNTKEDEEWKDFASGEQDLTGLKIQTTLGEEVTDSSKQPQEASSYHDNSDNEEEGGGPSSMPTRTTGQAWSTDAMLLQEEEEEASSPFPSLAARPQSLPPPSTSATGGAYVPPQLRSGSQPSRVVKKKRVPDINSIEAFPTLGGQGNVAVGEPSGMRDFQTVRGSGSGRVVESTREPIAHRNKYAALQSP